MKELVESIPDPDVLLGLEPEELGAKILFLLRFRERRPGGERMFSPYNIRIELPQLQRYGVAHYPQNRHAEIDLALSEAFAWLEAQGLIVPAPDMNGQNGWRVMSRRARKFESEDDVARFAGARSFRKEALHPAMSAKVWSAFMRGDFDVAVLQAMKAVEVSVREAAQLGNDLVGVPLMTAAFKDGGPLADTETERGEQVARMNLFAGAIGSYKNPHSHRDVRLENPDEAIEIVTLANHLLRIVDQRRLVLQSKN